MDKSDGQLDREGLPNPGYECACVPPGMRGHRGGLGGATHPDWGIVGFHFRKAAF